MKNGIVIVAHAPLAGALRECVAHVFPDHLAQVRAVDVRPQDSVEQSLMQARQVAAHFGSATPLLVLTDVLGATPCNVACRLQKERDVTVIAGVNLPMLLRSVTYLHEPMDKLVELALKGGMQGMVQVEAAD